MNSYNNHKDIQFKSVILFRHGKSDWDARYDSDHDRPLAKRGIRDAKRMGKFLSKRAEVPELILSSTALRTRETTKLAMARISFSTSDWKRVLLEPDKCILDWFYKPKSIS